MTHPEQITALAFTANPDADSWDWQKPSALPKLLGARHRPGQRHPVGFRFSVHGDNAHTVISASPGANTAFEPPADGGSRNGHCQ
ncbi:hypothetical protein [Motiliproteus sediminis]|uniref:hypothetical protein n=1 Tax=Motiliproteus sediminis TaxID=1468178 RepID=UPI001AEFD2B0|nr:hypothetical protein [Motiliproteus sediminis]